MIGLTHVESPPLPVSLDSREFKRKEGAAAMKEQAIQYLAMDVHQATIVAWARRPLRLTLGGSKLRPA
jgi:hypothetical protein